MASPDLSTLDVPHLGAPFVRLFTHPEVGLTNLNTSHLGEPFVVYDSDPPYGGGMYASASLTASLSNGLLNHGDLPGMDVAHLGAPFVPIATNRNVASFSMDVAFLGAPFIAFSEPAITSLASSLAAVADLSSDLDTHDELDASLGATGEVTAFLMMDHPALADLASAATITPEFTVESPIESSLAAVSSFTSDLSENWFPIDPLVASITARAGIGASLSKNTNIATRANQFRGKAEITATLSYTGSMASTISGSASVSALFGLPPQLAASIVATASSGPDLREPVLPVLSASMAAQWSSTSAISAILIQSGPGQMTGLPCDQECPDGRPVSFIALIDLPQNPERVDCCYDSTAVVVDRPSLKPLSQIVANSSSVSSVEADLEVTV